MIKRRSRSELRRQDWNGGENVAGIGTTMTSIQKQVWPVLSVRGKWQNVKLDK